MIVGLTGGIASGKTQASNFFAQFGVHIEDADEVSRNLTKQGTEVYAEICRKFCEFCKDGVLDRKALRQEISSNSNSKKWLESLIHPKVLQQIKQNLKKATGAYKIISSPLLFEVPFLRSLVDRVLLIDVNEALQIERGEKRDGVSKEDIKGVIKIQMPRAQKLKLADDIIENTGSLAQLQASVQAQHKFYLEISKKI